MMLLYRQRHHAKLAQDEAPTGVSGTPAQEQVALNDRQAGIKSQIKMDRGPIASIQREYGSKSVAISGTNASSVNKAGLANYAKSVALSGLTAANVERRQALDVPFPPGNVDERTQKVLCLYCSRWISKNDTKEPRWTRHVLKDISPYICLFEECGVGDALIQSPDEWIKHMQWSHTVEWCCLAPGHELDIYDSSLELEDHMRAQHSGSFTESQLPSLVLRGARPAPNTLGIWTNNHSTGQAREISSNPCLLCQNFKIETTVDNAGLNTSRSLYDHLLEHLETIALLSLPEMETSNDIKSNTQESGGSGRSTVQWARKLSELEFETPTQEQIKGVQGGRKAAEEASAKKDDSFDDFFFGATMSGVSVPDVKEEQKWKDICEIIQREQRASAGISEPADDTLLQNLHWCQRLQKWPGGDIDTSEAAERLSSIFSSPPKHFSEPEIGEIQQILRVINASWSEHPRLYIILATSGNVSQMEHFMQLGWSDVFLPLTVESLKDILPGTSSSILHSLLNAQARVIPDDRGTWLQSGNALQTASHRGQEQIVKVLLDKGADVNAQGGEYGNALQAASYAGHEQIAKLLLDKGADVNAQGGEYGNALQAASYAGHEQIAKLLINMGADVNAQGGPYGNALRAARGVGHEMIVKLLLDKGGAGYGNRYKQTGTTAGLGTEIKVHGEEHPVTLTSMANLASTYRNQGRWKEAEELEVQVMETRKRVLGEEHPDTLTSMANLASTYRNQGRWNEAEELGVQVMEMSSRVLGGEHPSTLTSMANLASTYRNQGRWKEAEELDVQVMETRKRVLGEEHPDTLTSMANLVSTYRNQGRWKEAEELDVQVMETSSRVLGEGHPDTLNSMANLAHTWAFLSRKEEAITLMEKCFKLQSHILGPNNPHTEFSYKALNKWQKGN